MSKPNQAPVLVVAGVHNEKSFGWSAAEAWLERDPNNEVVITARGDSSVEFVQARAEETEGRIDYVAPIDWTEGTAVESLQTYLQTKMGDERQVAGVVHSIAWAPPENFTTPAHELEEDVYAKAHDATSLSFLRLIKGARSNLTDSAGIVTFGFGEHDRVYTEYGAALSQAKADLSKKVKDFAVSLGRETPSARTAEVVTWFVPTYAGRGVLAGIGKHRGQRLKPNTVEDYASQELSAIRPSSSDQQRINAGQVAVSFIADGMWSQTTGQRFEINAGVPLLGAKIFPEES